MSLTLFEILRNGAFDRNLTIYNARISQSYKMNLKNLFLRENQMEICFKTKDS